MVGVVACADGKEREVIHEALEQITHISRFALLSDMGDVFRATHPLKYLLRTSYPPAIFRKPMAK